MRLPPPRAPTSIRLTLFLFQAVDPRWPAAAPPLQYFVGHMQDLLFAKTNAFISNLLLRPNFEKSPLILLLLIVNIFIFTYIQTTTQQHNNKNNKNHEKNLNNTIKKMMIIKYLQVSINLT